MALDGQYIVAQSAKITIHSGTSTQATVKGLQGMALPLGATASTISLSTIGTRISTKVVSGLEYDAISTSYYFAVDDPTQQYLMNCSRASTLIQDMWFWIDADDFAALDKVNDPGGGMMVGTFSSPTAQKNEVFSGTCEFVVSGSHIFYNTHAKAATAVFSLTAGGAGVSATATSADTTNYSFEDLGFEVGQVVIINGVTGHTDRTYYAQVKTVTDSTLTFEDAIGDEAIIPTTSAASTVQIHGATPIEVADTF